MGVKVSFLLPSLGDKPGGGYKIVLEYANRLTKKGIIVDVVYPLCVKNRGLIMNIIGTLYRLLRFIFRRYSSNSWFNLSKNVKEKIVWRLSDRYLPKSDLYIATAVGTAMDLNQCNIPKNKELYFIQGYEDWSCSVKVLEATYNYGMTNIVVSNWLKELLSQKGVKSYLVRNAFDFEYFTLTKPVAERDKLHISLLYSENPIKGTQYALEALKKLKNEYPEIKVSMFGIYNKPIDLESWITYYKQPNQETHNFIYNTSSIFIAPSINEGWGLTVGEAMICGNAVVCTSNKGHFEMATDMKTALLCPIKDSQAIYDRVKILIENDALRYSIANNGLNNIKKYTWEKSVDALYEIIIKHSRL